MHWIVMGRWATILAASMGGLLLQGRQAELAALPLLEESLLDREGERLASTLAPSPTSTLDPAAAENIVSALPEVTAASLAVPTEAALLMEAPTGWAEERVLEFLNRSNDRPDDLEFDRAGTISIANPDESNLPSSELDVALPADSNAATLGREQAQLQLRLETELPLDPSQVDIHADQLSYDSDEKVASATGNARIQFADGTIVEGDRLLFYRSENRLASDGAFRLIQAIDRAERSIRVVRGRNLNYFVETRTASLEDAYAVVPGEQPGTYVHIRSATAIAELDARIVLHNATVTTSTGNPITHYIEGDRVEIDPDNSVAIRWARVFVGGDRAEDGSLRAGRQVALFPLFIYSLRAHQWVLPGFSPTEGAFLKSSWAYRFNESHFGGFRLDLLQEQGVGLGFLHDYRLPITAGNHFGRAQFYWLTEADENRTSNRFRLAHRFELPQHSFLSGDRWRGQVDINLDNTVRPAGGRNDRADFRLNSSYTTPLSLTTLDVSRFGSRELGGYTLPATLNHSQRFSGIDWLRTNSRLSYVQSVSHAASTEPASSDFRWNLSAIAHPDWGNAIAIYRGLNRSTDDLEARRNFEFSFASNPIRLGAGVSLAGRVGLYRNQVADLETRDLLRFYTTASSAAVLRFSPIHVGRWLTLSPSSIQYEQIVYSSGDGESAVTIDPSLLLSPVSGSELDIHYFRTMLGDNSVPFDIPRSHSDRHRLEAALTLKTPSASVTAPPGFIAFEDDLPGEQPIPLLFEDDTLEDREAIERQQQIARTSDLNYALQLHAHSGYNFVEGQWEHLTADLSLATAPTLLNLNVSASYDPNERELLPIALRYGQLSSTTFDRNLRSGLDSYEPGLSYSLQAIYDPRDGKIRYGVNADLTIGTRWQNHWRIRLGLNRDGIDLVEVRRDLRDFELRFVAEPQNELFRIEGILVAFPSRPLGLTQQRGEFFADTTPELLNDNDFNRSNR